MSDIDPTYKSNIVYQLEDKIPPRTAAFVGIQHVMAMFVGVITMPLVVSGALKFSLTDTAYLVSIGAFYLRHRDDHSDAGNWPDRIAPAGDSRDQLCLSLTADPGGQDRRHATDDRDVALRCAGGSRAERVPTKVA